VNQQQATTPPLIELRGMTKAFPDVLANDAIDLAVRGGEIHCLLGENGAGKSTLIGILCGLVRPDAGTILIEGVETPIRSPRHALELGIGTVHQHSALIPALTVLENLMLGDSRRLRLDEGRARSRLCPRSSASRSTRTRRHSTSRSATSSRSRSSRRSGAARGCSSWTSRRRC